MDTTLQPPQTARPQPTGPASRGPVIIAAHELVKQYPGAVAPAVAGVSFEIAEGEIFSLLGPNGAGKTTVISMLSCLIRPTSGDATISGHSVTRDGLAVKRALGIVPQELALYTALSARQNLRFWGQMYDMGGKELERRVDEVLEQIGLSARADDKVATYSGGMKRRVNIGIGLLHRPRVLFLDEPTVAIDPQSRRNILDLVKELNRAGMTVLYTTHYMEEAEELSHRVGIIDHGKLIALGTQSELTQLVGQYDTLYLEVDRDAEALAPALAALPGVHLAKREDERLMILVDDANAALPSIIVRANQDAIRINRIEIQAPNLEAVFLHLTGRALRD